MGPKVIVLLGSGASTNNLKRAKQTIKGAAIVGSIKDGIPESIKKGDIVLVVSPSSPIDYQVANKMAAQGLTNGVVLINGFSKVRFAIYIMYYRSIIFWNLLYF